MSGEYVTINDKNLFMKEDKEQKESNTPVWSSASHFSPYSDASVLSMCRADHDNILVCSCFNREILLLNKGHVTQAIYADVGLKDFSVSPRTDHIWMLSYHDDNVREIEVYVPDGKTSSRFKTDRAATSICVTSDDLLVLGYDGDIVKCTQTGEIICKASDRSSSSSICFPHRIKECPVTKHLAVVDLDSVSHGGRGIPRVYVLNDNLETLYSYQDDAQGQAAQSRGTFHPRDVCFTYKGQPVVVDSNEGSVLLLSDKGEFLQTLFTHSAKASAVCTFSNGDVYVSFTDKSVHVLREL